MLGGVGGSSQEVRGNLIRSGSLLVYHPRSD